MTSHSALAPLAALIFSYPGFAQSAQNVLLVVNESSTDSRRIAAYYVSKRSVPLANVCRIRVPPAETIQWDSYVREVETPLRQCVEKLQGRAPILFIVTTLGVPLRVSGSGSGAGAQTAALDSELALLYGKMRGAVFPRAGAVPNPFFGRRGQIFQQARFPIFLVVRLAAYDAATVIRMIDRSLAARNRGTVVLDAAGDDRSGDDWLIDTALRLPKDRVLLDTTPRVVLGRKQVIGYASWGSNDRQRKQRNPGFEWLPGAIVNEYVSTNGRTLSRPPANWNLGSWSDKDTWFAGSPQSLSADYLDYGATGASGHVDEPFLRHCPRPDLLFPAYLEGRTLAESFYLAMPSLSWQNVIFGDPLCRLQ